MATDKKLDDLGRAARVFFKAVSDRALEGDPPAAILVSGGALIEALDRAGYDMDAKHVASDDAHVAAKLFAEYRVKMAAEDANAIGKPVGNA